MEYNIKENFIKSLIEIYNLEIINFLLEFVQGEQAVLFAMYLSKIDTSSKLAEKLNVTKSRMTFIINNLLKKEYIETYQKDDDKRIKYLNLTNLGTKYIKEKEQMALSVLTIYVDKMGDDKILNLTDLLNDTTKIMKEE